MSATPQLCTQCHARVALETDQSPAQTTCPACGGQLIADENTPTSAGPTQTDHRGIILPPRHAVGGVITPR